MLHGAKKIRGDGETAELIRQTDWANTPLGPLDTWTSTLLSSVNMALAIPTPIQILWGGEMTILYNDPFIPILTHKHPHAMGRAAQEVWAEVWPSVGTQLEDVFTEGNSYHFEDLPLQILDHGEMRHNFFTFTYSPIRDADGQIVGLLNISQNTTAAVLAQQALRKSEQRFRTLIHSASVGIAIGQATGEFTYMNPALLEILHFSAEDVSQGRVRWDNITPREFADADRYAIEQLRAFGRAQPYEKAYCNKEGTAIPLLVGASMILVNEDLSGSGDIAVFATDLRKQKRAERALLQSEKLAAVGKLASSISHEINNPLEAVTNLLYLIRHDQSLSLSTRDFLDTADRELARVSQVTSQTLRFHRQSTLPQEVDPRELIEEVLQLYAPRLRNMGVTTNRDGERASSLTCYEGDIRQVLNNLIGNAVDSMRTSGGLLSIRTRPAYRASTGKEGVLVTVADAGTGISNVNRQKIFDAFYTTKGINGTGLGLWISCRIVHKHRGYIRCFSSTHAARHGSVFQLWLPKELASTAQEAWHDADLDASTSF